jgi:hypothetical protein
MEIAFQGKNFMENSRGYGDWKGLVENRDYRRHRDVSYFRVPCVTRGSKFEMLFLTEQTTVYLSSSSYGAVG